MDETTGSEPIDEGTRARVEAAVSEAFDRDGAPGLAYGVVVDDRLVMSGGRGRRGPDGDPPDASTVFRIASMSKSFTAAAVLLLRDRGLLRLDDPVRGFVPDAATLDGPDGAVVTVRDLLTMAAGLPKDDPWADRCQDMPDRELARLLAAGPRRVRAPGTAYEYSNLGYAVLGRVVAAAAGRPWRDVVRHDLLDPLGMADTAFEVGEVPPGRLAQGHRRGRDAWVPEPFAGHGAFAPMGGLFSSVRDLARWVAWFAGAFPAREGGDGGHPLSRASRREAQRPHHAMVPVVEWPTLAAPPRVIGGGYGYGLVVEDDQVLGRIVSHSGGYPGFGSHMRWHPDSGIGVVVLGNGTYAPASPLAVRLLRTLLPVRPAGDRAGTAPWPEVDRARDLVTRMLREGWDGPAVAAICSPNVPRDRSWQLRAEELSGIRERFGPFSDDPEPVQRPTASRCVWWLRGVGGAVRCELAMTPEARPRVQTLLVGAVPDPRPELLGIAEAVTAALDAPAPELVLPDLSDVPDPEEVRRAVRVAGAWTGPARVDRVLAGDGGGHLVVRVVGTRGRLRLEVRAPQGTGRPTAVVLSPGPL